MALFHGIHMEFWTVPYGMMMESILNEFMEYMLEWAKQVWIPSSFHMEQSGIPYGIQGDHGTRK